MVTRRNVVTIVSVLALALLIVSCGRTVSAGGNPQADTDSQFQQAVTSALPGISVVGRGVVNAAPDVALVDLGVAIVASEANEAFSENTTRMKAVMDVLTANGIQEQDIQTVSYNMWIEQVYDRDGQPTGENRYHVVHQVRVRVRDLETTGDLLQQALEAGANNVGGISFGVADSAALQGEARDKALVNAQAKAEQLAKSLGVKLGAPRQVIELSGQATPFPAAHVVEGIGGGPVPVSGGEFSVTVDIQLVFDISE
jgi:uncharacterized protein YggE